MEHPTKNHKEEKSQKRTTHTAQSMESEFDWRHYLTFRALDEIPIKMDPDPKDKSPWNI